MKLFLWVLWNALLCTVAWFGAVEKVEGAANVMRFFVWVTVSFAFLANLLPEQKQIEIRAKGRSAPPWANITVDVAVSVLLIYCGWWYTGTANFLSMLFTEALYQPPSTVATDKP